MKRAYTKPEIFYESFSLSQNIAANCEIKPKDPSLELPPLGFAFTSQYACDVDVVNSGGDGGANGVCYHVFNQSGDNPINVATS